MTAGFTEQHRRLQQLCSDESAPRVARNSHGADLWVPPNTTVLLQCPWPRPLAVCPSAQTAQSHLATPGCKGSRAPGSFRMTGQQPLPFSPRRLSAGGHDSTSFHTRDRKAQKATAFKHCCTRFEGLQPGCRTAEKTSPRLPATALLGIPHCPLHVADSPAPL